MKILEILNCRIDTSYVIENYKLAMADFSKEANQEEVKSNIEIFKRISSRISDPEKKDINYWRKQGYENFVNFIDEVNSKDSKRKRISRIKAASDQILTVKKTDRSHLFFPLSKEASCFYGSGTPWCISTRDGKNYFYEYTVKQQYAICFLIYDDNVYALVFDPKTFNIVECQDKNNNNTFPPNEFFKLSSVNQAMLMEFVHDNYDTIFSNLKKFEKNNDQKDKTKFIHDTKKRIEMYLDGDYGRNITRIRDDLVSIKRMFSENEQYISIFKKHFEPLIIKDAQLSYYYANDVLGHPFNAGESIIATDALYSCYYASHTLKGRFKKGEPAIAQSPRQSYEYAVQALKGRFEKGEPAIAKDALQSRKYAEDVVKGRFTMGEPAIAKNSEEAYWYARLSPEHKQAMLDLGADI